jgi:hypothetical protein
MTFTRGLRGRGSNIKWTPLPSNGTYKYYLTRLGQKVVTTALKLETLFVIPSLAEPVTMAT